MLQQKIKKQVGNYVVTPLSHPAASGLFVASVSIRRGVYDRIFSFVPQFASEMLANRYALSQAHSMVRQNQFC